jgi:hypothetical protein
MRAWIQLPISPGDHSHQDAIPAYKMTIKRGAEMRGDESRDEEADQATLFLVPNLFGR